MKPGIVNSLMQSPESVEIVNSVCREFGIDPELLNALIAAKNASLGEGNRRNLFARFDTLLNQDVS